MTIPVWILLGFAGWTLLTLLSTIGVYRWSRILTGKAEIKEFPADVPHGSPWYRRAMRAHANCVENLPVYTALVVAIIASGVQSPMLDRLAIVFLVGRILQTTLHIGFEPSNLAVSLRFSCFLIQLICMVWMGIFIAIYG